MKSITREHLISMVEYFPQTGKFKYRKRDQHQFLSRRACNAWNARFAEADAGCMDSRGYIQIKIDGVKHLAHRLAFIYMFGEAPETIDHIDRNKLNNSIDNLRPATRSQNAANRRSSKSKGAFLRKSGKYSSQICINYKIKHLGTFDTKDQAQKAYESAAKQAFGEYFYSCTDSDEVLK